MSKKKSEPKKTSIEYVRPQPGKFTLEKFPGVEFKFRLISVDDESWSVATFGKRPWEILTSGTAQAAELCKLYFYFLVDESKANFIPVKKEEMNYETGETEVNVISGPRLFMQSIDGGSLTEMMLISSAFFQTVVASRPISDLPEDVKKNLLSQIEKNKKKLAEVSEKLPNP